MADQASLYTATRAITLNVLRVYGASEPDRLEKFGVTHEMLDGSISEQIAGGRRDITIDFFVMTALQRRQVVDWWLDPLRQVRSIAGTPVVTAGNLIEGGALTPGTTYYYRVCALDVIGHSIGSTAVSKEAGPGGSETALTIPLTWPAVTGARRYKIYRSADAEATYDLIDYSETNSYTDAGTAIYMADVTVPSAVAAISVITTNELQFLWANETELARLLTLELREASIFTAANAFESVE